MNYRKPLVASLLVSGLALGATGVASAQYGDGGDPAPEPTTEAEVVESDEGIVDVQDVQEDDDAETDGDADRERRGHRGNKLGTLAEAIGITADELKAELQAGSTIADVAEANGVDVDDVIDAIVAEKTERLDAKVASGDITEEEAAEKLERKTERISDRINGVSDAGDRGERGNRGGDAETSIDA